MSRTKPEDKDAQNDHHGGHDDDRVTGGTKNPHKSTCNENDASHYAFQGYPALCPHCSGLLLGNSIEGRQEVLRTGPRRQTLRLRQSQARGAVPTGSLLLDRVGIQYHSHTISRSEGIPCASSVINMARARNGIYKRKTIPRI